MAVREARRYKALYFDLRIKDLRTYFSESSPKGAYAQIQRFLTAHGFTREQYSGYHSVSKTTDLEIFDLVREMSDSFPWFHHCVNRFEVTNVGANHDLTELFADEAEDPFASGTDALHK